MLEFTAEVKDVRETPIKGVVLVECRGLDRDVVLTFEYPQDTYPISLGHYVRFSPGEKVVVQVSRERAQDLTPWDLYMSGLVYHVKEEKFEERDVVTYYISVGGYQVRLRVPKGTEVPLELHTRIYIGVRKCVEERKK